MKKALMFLLVFLFSTLTLSAQIEDRVFKLGKSDNAERGQIEITSFKVNDKEVFFNEAFPTDENWLRDVKIKIKNMTGKSLTCVVVVFGLLGGIDEEIPARMSWAWGLGYSYKNCGGDKNKKKIPVLKNGAEAELVYSALAFDGLEKNGFEKFHKAELIYVQVIYKNGDEKDVDVRIVNNVRRFFEDGGKNK